MMCHTQIADRRHNVLTVPAVETNTGLKMVQTQAILHYIGRSAGMDCDCEDLYKCEALALGVGQYKIYTSRYQFANLESL